MKIYIAMREGRCGDSPHVVSTHKTIDGAIKALEEVAKEGEKCKLYIEKMTAETISLTSEDEHVSYWYDNYIIISDLKD